MFQQDFVGLFIEVSGRWRVGIQVAQVSRITAASDACPACPEFRLIIPPTPQTVLYIIQQQFLHQRRASPRSYFPEIPIMVSLKILVAIDGSEAGETALNWTLKHLKVEDTSLDVVTGVGMPVVQLCDGTHIHLTARPLPALTHTVACCSAASSRTQRLPSGPSRDVSSYRSCGPSVGGAEAA